ncbi:putative phosphatase regulatory subunit-domain-containing protein [Lactarius akahatsu]|uniref:Phosphatase regulatory subunit-domain-containing protein n=1 Tax=Lactarius akahatsu TaxID=416441 RepID=A0AAD4QDM3_9AGAM|nr:putative phosphatase regulatory subunit-domain-containing protein [Lactarius akahatsu]
MSSTVLTTHGCSLPGDICYSRNSSAAPLPLIPRRPSSVPNSRRVSPLVAPLADSPPAGVIFTRASPPTTPAHSNLASTETPQRQDLVLTFLHQFLPPPCPLIHDVSAATAFLSFVPRSQSTPTPAKADSGSDTPRQNTSVPFTRNLSESHVHTLAAAAAARSEPSPPLLRKKSGEPLKSSLKVKRTPARGSLTVITDPVGLSSSKSAPATPGNKGVRFHSQLEQVKHFLAEQKPIAVSRDGSPTDTSGTDSEFPPFIYGRDGDDLTERALVMHRVDVPTAPLLADDTRDVVVESVDLVGTTIEGIVRVRNIAFEKWVAVRFTLDKWQTTSEVTARYKESLHDGAVDRFMFSIKLTDVLSRAEEKTLFIAVRYSVAGREIWDNNNNRNYQVRVVREKPTKPTPVAAEKPPTPSHADEIAVLRHKLEEVVKLGRPSDTIGGILAQHSRRRWGSPSRTPTPPSRDATPSFKSEGSLAARYDFATSLRTPWRAPAAPSSPAHARTSTYPSALPNSVPWPQPSSARAPCGSPRDTADGTFFFHERDSDSDDAISRTPSLRRSHSSSGSRNHTRGGAFELSQAPGVKRTPPTSPFGSPELPFATLSTAPLTRPQPPSPARCHSFPPHSSPKQHHQAQGWVVGGSEESTPSVTSSSSSRSSSPTPSLSPAELVVVTPLAAPAAGDVEEKCDSPLHHLGNYHTLLNRFCFFTGSAPDGTMEHSDTIPRSLSASSVEEFLSVGQSPPLGGSPYRSSSPFATPRAHGRISAMASDDELQRSGSVTPTGPTMRRLPRTPPSPLLF